MTVQIARFRRAWPLWIAMALAGSIAGCGKSPDAVCQSLQKLAGADGKPADSDDAKLSQSICVSHMQELKTASSTAYGCVAKCTDLGSADKAETCINDCVSKDPKLKVMAMLGKAKENAVAGSEAESWAKRPTKSFDGSVSKGDTNAKFSIDLVEGFSTGL